MKTPNYDYVYRAQGSLLSNARSYVERDADSNLYEAIKKGEFCYVFNARQMGKSSLCVKVANRLQEEDGYRCAVLDLTRVGGDEYLEPVGWYRSLITDLNRSLSLLSVSEFDAWLNDHKGQTSAYALSQFIDDIILVRTQNQPIVIFVDEIDNVLSLSFTTSDLFAVIRACYNQQSHNPIYQRLTFVLLGVATPTKLIRDTNRTPFNIGKSIQLAPLELKRAGQLEEGLVGWSESSSEVLKEIFSWTGGQPYLTQKLCELVQTDAMGNGIIVASNSSNRVAEVVERHLIKDWQLKDVQSHFRPIQGRMLRQPHLVSRVLDLYGRILRVGEIEADFTDEATIELQLSGVVVQSGETLRSYNRIYRHIFSADWVMEALSEIRPYAASFNQWVASGCKGEENLLQGSNLTKAENWAQRKSLSGLDNQYLREGHVLATKKVQKQAKWARRAAVGVVVIGAVILSTIGLTAVRAIDARKQAIDARKQAIDARDEALRDSQKYEKLAEERAKDSNEAQENIEIQHAELERTKIQMEEAEMRANTASLQQELANKDRIKADKDRIKADMARVMAEEENKELDALSFLSRSQSHFLAKNRIDAQVSAIKGAQMLLRQQKQSPLISTAVWTLDSAISLAVRTLDSAISLEFPNSSGAYYERNRIVSGIQGNISSISFSHNDDMIATAGSDGSVKLWDAKTGAERGSVETGQSYVGKVVFSSDGTKIATVDFDLSKIVEGLFSAILESNGNNDLAETLLEHPTGSVKLWERKGNEIAEIAALEVYGYSIEDLNIASPVSFSPDGRTFTTIDGIGRVKLWNFQGAELASFDNDQGLTTGVSFSPDGSKIATVGIDFDSSPPPLPSSPCPDDNDDNSSNSPSSEILPRESLTSSVRGNVKLWNLQGAEPMTFDSCQGIMTDVSFSPDGYRIATVGIEPSFLREAVLLAFMDSSFSDSSNESLREVSGGSVKLWNLQGTIDSSPVYSDRGLMTGMSFSPDGSKVVTVATNIIPFLSSLTSLSDSSGGEPLSKVLSGSVNLWDSENMEKMASLNISGRSVLGIPTTVTFGGDSMLATTVSDGTVQLWDDEGRQQASFNANIMSEEGVNGALKLTDLDRLWDNTVTTGFSHDGSTVATASDGTVRIWTKDRPVRPERSSLNGHDGWVQSVSFSHDSSTIITASNDNTIKLWDLQGNELISLDVEQGDAYGASFSPDSNAIATVGGDGSLKLWSRKGQELMSVQAHDGPTSLVSFSPNGDVIATVGMDGFLKLWNLGGQNLMSVQAHRGFSTGVSFSPDGNLIATVGSDGMLRLWEREGNEITSVEAHQSELFGIYSVSFSPDGNFIATAGQDGMLKVWDRQGNNKASEQGEIGIIHSVKFGSDGTLIATGGNSGRLKVWNFDGNNLFEETSISAHSKPISSVSFSPDGTTIATASTDNSVGLWPLGSDSAVILEDLIETGCDLLKNYLLNNPEGKKEAKNGVCEGYLPES